MMKLNAIDVPSVDLDMRKEFEDPEVIEDVTPKAGETGIEDSAGEESKAGETDMEDSAGKEENV